MLRLGKLRDLLRNVEENSPVAMNVLDLPLGRATVPVPPLYLDVATDAYCVNLVKHLIEIVDTGDATCWGTAGTVDALSWGHIDDVGLSTSVSVQAGSKYWVLARRKNANPRADEMSDFRTFDGWKVDDIDKTTWDVEAIHLNSRCVL